jgi:acetyl esterase/lipase
MKQADMLYPKLIAVMLSALLLAGCSALGLYNHLQVGGLQPSVANLAYGDHPRQTLDLYLPDKTASPAPLLVWFYGGGWDSGDKAHYAFVASRFNELGYAVAIPDYRLVPEVQFPAFVSDGAEALRRLVEYADQHPDTLAPQPLVLAGHSAGAYIAVQLVADPTYLARVGLARQDIAGIIGLSGPYDFYPYVAGPARAAFGDAPARESQPVLQDLSQMPPLLLITGDRDTTVLPLNSVHLAEAAPAARLERVAGMAHTGTLLALGSFATSNEQVLRPITEFLNAIRDANSVAYSE